MQLSRPIRNQIDFTFLKAYAYTHDTHDACTLISGNGFRDADAEHFHKLLNVRNILLLYYYKNHYFKILMVIRLNNVIIILNNRQVYSGPLISFYIIINIYKNHYFCNTVTRLQIKKCFNFSNHY